MVANGIRTFKTLDARSTEVGSDLIWLVLMFGVRVIILSPAIYT